MVFPWIYGNFEGFFLGTWTLRDVKDLFFPCKTELCHLRKVFNATLEAASELSYPKWTNSYWLFQELFGFSGLNGALVYSMLIFYSFTKPDIEINIAIFQELFMCNNPFLLIRALWVILYLISNHTLRDCWKNSPVGYLKPKNDLAALTYYKSGYLCILDAKILY